MNKFIIKLLILFFILTNNTIAEENIMILKLKDGDIKIELFEDVATTEAVNPISLNK